MISLPPPSQPISRIYKEFNFCLPVLAADLTSTPSAFSSRSLKKKYRRKKDPELSLVPSSSHLELEEKNFLYVIFVVIHLIALPPSPCSECQGYIAKIKPLALGGAWVSLPCRTAFNGHTHFLGGKKGSVPKTQVCIKYITQRAQYKHSAA